MALFKINGNGLPHLNALPIIMRVPLETPHFALDRRLRDIERTIGPTASATLAFEPGVYRIGGEFEFGPSVAWWFAPGAMLDVRGRLIIQGPVCAPAQQIFTPHLEEELATSRVFLHGSRVQQVPEVLPQWWGAGLEDDQGQGLQAMAQSLAFAHPTLISFGPGTYLARPMTFKPGHRFTAPRFATLKAALPSPFLMTILHEGPQKAPRTSFEGLSFEGHEPPASTGRLPPPYDALFALFADPNRAATSPSPTQDLLVVQSTQHSEVPLTLVSCMFSKASGTGVLLHSGASIQAHRLFASQCQTAGLVMHSSNTPSTLQWSNRDSPQRPFAADVILGDLASKTVLQLSDVTLQGRLQVQGNAHSRITLVRCHIKETLNIHAPGAYVVVVESHIESQNTAGSQVQSPAVALFGKGCTWSTKPERERGEEGVVEPASMTIQWEDQGTLVWPGVSLVGDGTFNEPEETGIKRFIGLRAQGRPSGPSPIIVLDNTVLNKNFTSLLAENRISIFVQGDSKIESLRVLLNTDLELAVSRTSKASFGFIDNSEFFNPSCVQFMGKPRRLRASLLGSRETEGLRCVLGGRVLLVVEDDSNALELPTWAFRGDLIVRSAQPSIVPTQVCLHSSSLKTVWYDVISGDNGSCSSVRVHHALMT